MSKLLAIALTALLMAAAFFLPAQLSQWNDRLLLDEPHIFQEEEREGFARSVGLTVAEKVLLLRGGNLDSLNLTEGELRATFSNREGELRATFSTDKDAVYAVGLEEDGGDAQRKWTERITAVQAEVRSLQIMGALPAMWSADSDVECVDRSQILYVDRDTQVSFSVYYMILLSGPYSLELRVDAQSGQVLSFSLYWTRDGAPSWGVQGAAGFGGAWRDYWGMDSVNASWYNEYTRSILEETEARMRVNGEYNAVGDISYAYGGQRVHIPLRCWAYKNQCSLHWNQ